MNIDLLDFSMRAGKLFGVKIRLADWNGLPQRRPFDATAAEMHEWVTSIVRGRGLPVPWSSWTRVRLALAKTVGKSPNAIHRGTFIVRDLDFF